MKRTRQGDVMEDMNAMANCLISLSGTGAGHGAGVGGELGSRVFECKTCNKRFPSFQALGGHRAGHKKPRVVAADQTPSPVKAKTHECGICGLEFEVGQALGGHMRRHRVAVNGQGMQPLPDVARNRRVLRLLDLNLTPSENRFVFGIVAPTVDCFF